MKPNAYSADCPTRQILDRVGDKWAVLILLLIRHEPMRFNALRRATEGTSLVTEQFALHQVLRKGGAAHVHPGTRAAQRVMVYGPGDDLLTASALAGNEDCGVGAGSAFDQAQQFPHGRARDYGGHAEEGGWFRFVGARHCSLFLFGGPGAFR